MRTGHIDIVVVYEGERLTRSLDRFCPAGRDLRLRGWVVRVGDPAIQHDELDGAADYPFALLVRAVATGLSS
jgi:hypothetical protein